MVTPTFLAGFCIVLASILAYGTTQTHLLYSGGLPPACAEASCSSVGPHAGNGGGLGKTVSPGIGGTHGSPPSQPEHAAEPPATGGGGGGGAHPGRSPGAPAGRRDAPQRHSGHPAGGTPGPQVAVVYQTEKRWAGRFLATVTITNNGKTVLSGWQLRMRYLQVMISSLWGAQWFPASPRSGTGLVAARAGQHPLRPGMSARFVFVARGAPGTPGGCAFDGYRCTFRHHRAGKPGKPAGPRKPQTPGPGQNHAHHPGPSRAHNPGSLSAHLTALVLAGTARSGHAHAGPHAHARPHPHAKACPHARPDPHARPGPHANGQGHRVHHRRGHRHHDRKGPRFGLV